MNFAESENQLMIAQTIRDFAEKNIRPFVMEWDESQTLPIETLKKLGDGDFGAYRIWRIGIDLF